MLFFLQKWNKVKLRSRYRVDAADW